MSVNKWIGVANLGADPESRVSQSGTTVCNLRVATNERVKRGETWEDHTEWHRVVTFGKLAENCAKYLEKGRQVYIEGKLRTSKYTDKNGVEKYSTEIIADQVHFLGQGSKNTENGARSDYSGPASEADRDF
jgi:single-strand DNA-binding protein